jgi:hypothetical protein
MTVDPIEEIKNPTPDGFVVGFEWLAAQFIVRFDGWHDHFESAERAPDCLAFGFSGRARIAVTYRGRIPVKWVLEYVENDEWRADSEVGRLFVPLVAAQGCVSTESQPARAPAVNSAASVADPV